MAEKIKNFALGQYVAEAELTLDEKSRMNAILHEALARRVRFAIAKTREARQGEMMGDYLQLRNRVAAKVDETLLDVAKVIGKSVVKRAAPNAYKALSPLIQAYRKKKTTAKVGIARKIAKPKRKKTSLSTSPVQVNRHTFAAALKAAGGNLSKVKIP